MTTLTEYLTTIHGVHYRESIAMFGMHLSAIVATRRITFIERMGTYELGLIGMCSTILILLTYKAIDWVPTMTAVFLFHWLHYNYVAKCNREMKEILWHIRGARTFYW